MGETDQIKIGNLIIGHGTRAGLNPAKAHLELGGGQVNYMAGHVHRRTFWQREGFYYGVQSVTSGCLCQLQPHYASYQTGKTAWEHGTCIADVGLDDNTVQFDNLKFTSKDGIIYTRYHHQTFTAKDI